MTREEAIMVLKNEQPHCGKKALFPEEKKYEAYDVAIKALEQEPKSEWQKDHEILKAYSNGANDVLDKIKSDIESDKKKWWYGVDNDCFMKLSDVLKIIDKYKSESEE